MRWRAFALTVVSGVLLVLPDPTSATEYDFIWGNPTPQGNYLTAMDIENQTTGYAVGYNGAVVRTGDGGFTWSDLTDYPTFPHTLYGVATVGSDVVVASGVNPGLFRSTDGGMTWSVVPSPPGDDLLGVDLIGPGTLCALGRGSVYRSTDDGVTWTEQVVHPWNWGWLRAQHWFDTTHGILVGDAGGFVTNDSGVTWDPIPDLESQPPFSLVLFSTDLDGIALAFMDPIIQSFGLVYVTNDGGLTWFWVGETETASMCGVAAGPQHYVLGSVIGRVYESQDGGFGWNTVYSDNESAAPMADMVKLPDGSLRICGDRGDLLISDGDVTTWAYATDRLPTRRALTIESLSFPTADTGYAAGEIWARRGSILKTTDGGQSWDAIGQPLYRAGPLAFRTTDFGVLAGAARTDGGPGGSEDSIAVTSDGGNSWSISTIDAGLPGVAFETQDLALPASGDILACMDRSDPDIRGCVMRSTDDGSTWHRRDTGLPLEYGLVELDFISDTHGFVSTIYGRLWETTDAGASWQPLVPDGDWQPVTGMEWLDATTCVLSREYVWPSGAYGVFRSTNAGQTWSQVITESARDLHFLDATYGVALLSPGTLPSGNTVMVTRDGGVTWEPVAIPLMAWPGGVGVNYDLGATAVAAVDGGFVVGGLHAELILADDATVSVGGVSGIPAGDRLLRAPIRVGVRFPLSFTVDVSGPARLGVYDVRGRSVRVLAADRYRAGEMVNLTWNGTDVGGRAVPAGVYFVHLRTGMTREAMKLVVNR